ncbi:hypothetical protein ACFQV8_10390 [Pseudonocardia benzenivorans]
MPPAGYCTAAPRSAIPATRPRPCSTRSGLRPERAARSSAGLPGRGCGELAGVARDHGAPDVARRLLDELLADPATPTDVRFDALVARARASLADGPDRLEELLAPIDVAARAVPGHAAEATAALLRAAAERAQGRHHTAADRARTAMALLGWRPELATTPTESDHLTAALATQWIGALLDAGATAEARHAADEIAPRLDADAVPSRQLAQLRLTWARAASNSAGTVSALGRAATDAAASGAPDLESACRAALAELHEASGRFASALEETRLRMSADAEDRARRRRFASASARLTDLAGTAQDVPQPETPAPGPRTSLPPTTLPGTTDPAGPRTPPRGTTFASLYDAVLAETRSASTSAPTPPGTAYPVLAGTVLDAATPMRYDPSIGTPLAPRHRPAPEATPTARPAAAEHGSGSATAPSSGRRRRAEEPSAPQARFTTSPMGDALLDELRRNGTLSDPDWGQADDVSRFRARNGQRVGSAPSAAEPGPEPPREGPAPESGSDRYAAAADWLASAIADIDRVWGKPDAPAAVTADHGGRVPESGERPGGRRRRAVEPEPASPAGPDPATGRAAGTTNGHRHSRPASSDGPATGGRRRAAAAEPGSAIAGFPRAVDEVPGGGRTVTNDASGGRRRRLGAPAADAGGHGTTTGSADRAASRAPGRTARPRSPAEAGAGCGSSSIWPRATSACRERPRRSRSGGSRGGSERCCPRVPPRGRATTPSSSSFRTPTGRQPPRGSTRCSTTSRRVSHAPTTSTGRSCVRASSVPTGSAVPRSCRTSSRAAATRRARRTPRWSGSPRRGPSAGRHRAVATTDRLQMPGPATVSSATGRSTPRARPRRGRSSKAAPPVGRRIDGGRGARPPADGPVPGRVPETPSPETRGRRRRAETDAVPPWIPGAPPRRDESRHQQPVDGSGRHRGARVAAGSAPAADVGSGRHRERERIDERAPLTGARSTSAPHRTAGDRPAQPVPGAVQDGRRARADAPDDASTATDARTGTGAAGRNGHRYADEWPGSQAAPAALVTDDAGSHPAPGSDVRRLPRSAFDALDEGPPDDAGPPSGTAGTDDAGGRSGAARVDAGLPSGAAGVPDAGPAAGADDADLPAAAGVEAAGPPAVAAGADDPLRPSGHAQRDPGATTSRPTMPRPRPIRPAPRTDRRPRRRLRRRRSPTSSRWGSRSSSPGRWPRTGVCDGDGSVARPELGWEVPSDSTGALP